MALTRNSEFDITGKAFESLAAPEPEPEAPAALPEEKKAGGTRGRGRPAGTGSERKISKPCSVAIYEDQRRAIHSIEYKLGKHNMMSSLIREALDEYLERHAGELGLSAGE